MRRAFLFAAGLVAAVACTAAPARPGALEPRYVAVHNTLAAMGLAQVGPIQRGALAEGREARFTIDLPRDCATLVAIGGADVRDLDLTVLDAEDKQLGKDTTADAEAAVKVCPSLGGRFTAVVKMTRGSGDFIVASWTGAPGLAAPAGAAAATAFGAGTCEAPLPLPLGASTGSTRKGEADHSGKCVNADAKEVVYRLDLEKRQRLVVEVDPTFDSVVYLRRDDCEEKEAEVACNDDVVAGTSKRPMQDRGSRIEEVLEPGPYFLFVDAAGSNGGTYRMDVELTDVPTLAETCRQAKPLGSHAAGALNDAFDQLHGSCDFGHGPEIPYRLDLPARARTRVVMHAVGDFAPVLHMRSSCADDKTEVACTDRGMRAADTALVATLDPGAYTVFADSVEKGSRGRFTLDVDLTLEGGKGVRGDACGDAIAITPEDKSVDGDTFEAKDDFAPTCAGKGGADMMYRFELPARSRVTARFDAEEGNHVFFLAKSCADRATDIACAASIDEMLNPGVYYLGVDGLAQGPFGRFSFKLRAKDVSLQEAACKAVPSIALGQTIRGTTAGAPDRFTASCAGRPEAQASGDRVFKLTLPSPQRVQLLLSTPSHDGVLAIRKSCLDPPGMKNVREAEAACNNDGPDTRHSKIDTTLPAGTYFVVVDGHQGRNEGTFTLEARAMPPK
ncbi:MAG: hypothetical protein KIT84_38200 [Labilithrix sp.]|nr:hypothetical protein [Labilithrix sp.]MCW5816892.1 hypothetical protein [Labilithrix sp.]